jgi:DNA-binding XRE family transcriptional regulator
MDDLTGISIEPTKLKAAREAAGFSQTAAGDAVGVVKQTISNIECGVMLPSANVLARLCALYGVDISEITNAKAA